MPRDELYSVCYGRKLAIIQSSSYSVYNRYYQSKLEKVYKTCGGSSPTEIPPPPKVEESMDFCLTEKYYTTKEGDTYDSIAKANLGVASVFLYIGVKLCLPTTCPTNLHKATDFYGKTIYIRAFGSEHAGSWIQDEDKKADVASPTL
ncbi:hypothetical protein NW759_016648 [Fusarium solani]|nr:hypothetical protein NW759_016648 [Fusarium solani]